MMLMYVVYEFVMISVYPLIIRFINLKRNRKLMLLTTLGIVFLNGIDWDVDWIRMSQDMYKWRALVNAVMNL
jgi:hypothetical protein